MLFIAFHDGDNEVLFSILQIWLIVCCVGHQTLKVSKSGALGKKHVSHVSRHSNYQPTKLKNSQVFSNKPENISCMLHQHATNIKYLGRFQEEQLHLSCY